MGGAGSLGLKLTQSLRMLMLPSWRGRCQGSARDGDGRLLLKERHLEVGDHLLLAFCCWTNVNSVCLCLVTHGNNNAEVLCAGQVNPCARNSVKSHVGLELAATVMLGVEGKAEGEENIVRS